MEINEFLELLETAIILMLADLMEYEKLEEFTSGKFTKFNEGDVTNFLEQNNKIEALALIY